MQNNFKDDARSTDDYTIKLQLNQQQSYQAQKDPSQEIFYPHDSGFISQQDWDLQDKLFIKQIDQDQRESIIHQNDKIYEVIQVDQFLDLSNQNLQNPKLKKKGRKKNTNNPQKIWNNICQNYEKFQNSLYMNKQKYFNNLHEKIKQIKNLINKNNFIDQDINSQKKQKKKGKSRCQLHHLKRFFSFKQQDIDSVKESVLKRIMLRKISQQFCRRRIIDNKQVKDKKIYLVTQKVFSLRAMSSLLITRNQIY